LYIVPEPDLASFILHCFSGTSAALFIGLAHELTTSFKDMNLIEVRTGLPKLITAVL
jgi:hypothetical protein